MCDVYSFSVTKVGTVLCILGVERERAIAAGENPDSHSLIAEKSGISEDECWKFDWHLEKDDIANFEARWAFRLAENEFKSSYDGGSDIADFFAEPEGVACLYPEARPVDRARKELNELKPLIKQALEKHFGQPLQEQVLGDLEPYTFVIDLSIAREPDKLEAEIVGDMGKTRRGYTFSLYDDRYEYSRLSFHGFNRCNNITKLFVNRYVRVWADVDKQTGEMQKHNEIVVQVHPVLLQVKEGEDANK